MFGKVNLKAPPLVVKSRAGLFLWAVDALILCQLSYLDFGGIVSSDFKFKITLNEAAALFFTDNFEERKKLGVLINPQKQTQTAN
ncbi:MAG: hypothetical protein PUE30_07895 [Spirochaetia bacterium]|nr:hypothetical protein [Spirochaetia bacterium]